MAFAASRIVLQTTSELVELRRQIIMVCCAKLTRTTGRNYANLS
jgi:hypothetical protein